MTCLVTPEAKRSERYIGGLTPSIRSVVNPVKYTTCGRVVSQAYIVEIDFVRNEMLKTSGKCRRLKGEV